jgi:SAM-dependent methyltransferase
MDETTKTKKHLRPLEWSIISGKGIDIGCGPDPITPDARRFDIEDGDANEISKYVHDQFDFVYSSHCLEHMHDPRQAVLEWWKLVKPGGHLFFIIPDEDLYEQGVFPSRFNPDHKATFTISKIKSWSPVSVNVIDLAFSLPNSRLVSLVLQDNGYDRRLLRFGRPFPFSYRVVSTIYPWLKNVTGRQLRFIKTFLTRRSIDQTLRPDVLAQIQCIVKKLN